jgi:hypothetical protein
MGQKESRKKTKQVTNKGRKKQRNEEIKTKKDREKSTEREQAEKGNNREGVHKSPPLEPILSQMNPFRLIDPHLTKVQLNVILPPTTRYSQWSLTLAPPNQNPINTSPLPHACHMSRPSPSLI